MKYAANNDWARWPVLAIGGLFLCLTACQDKKSDKETAPYAPDLSTTQDNPDTTKPMTDPTPPAPTSADPKPSPATTPTQTPPAVPAQPESPPQQTLTPEKVTLHKGQSHVTKEFGFEVVFQKTGVRIYPYNAKAEPLPVTGLSGTILMMPAKIDEPEKTLTLQVPASAEPGNREYLWADADLAAAPVESFRAKITIQGLQGDEIREITFYLPFLGLAPEMQDEMGAETPGARQGN